MVKQGQVYWYDFGDSDGSEPAFMRPAVVVQNDVLNDTRIKTTMICAVTSNTSKKELFGYVELPLDSGVLPKPSLVILTQIHTVNKAELDDLIGSLNDELILKITNRLCEVTRPMSFEELSVWRQQN